MIFATSTSFSESTFIATRDDLYPSFLVSNIALSCLITPADLRACSFSLIFSGEVSNFFANS